MMQRIGFLWIFSSVIVEWDLMLSMKLSFALCVSVESCEQSF